MRMSIVQQQLDGSLGPPELDVLSNVTGAVARIVSRLFQVRHPPGKSGLLGFPPCEIGNDEDPSSTAEGCSSYNKQPQCGRASVLEQHLVDPSTCELFPGDEHFSCGSYNGGADGEDTDLYLYITSAQDGLCNNGAAAWAVPCVLHLTTNRPVIATVNMCPQTLKDATPDYVTALMMHELLHGLGFSSSMFSAYINPDTLKPKGEDAMRKIVEVDGKEVLMVISETVKREARAQFNCQELEGAAFEDEGGVASADAHWEFTHFQGDLMLASTQFSVSGEPPRISRITMALMEDTGWYLGNWSAVGGLLEYAQGTGCILPMRGCAAMMQEQEQQQQQSSSSHGQSSSSSLFCSPSRLTDSRGQRCTASHRALGQCDVGIQFANGCGMARVTEDLPMCTLPNQMYPNPMVFGWKNAPGSRCFDIGLNFTAKGSGPSTQSDSPSMLTFPEGGSQGNSAACFPSKCQNGQHFVVIRGRELRCRAGEVLHLAKLMPGVFAEGFIGPCPEEAEVCQTHCPSCSSMGGVCHEGQCHCKLGYEGAACEHNLMGVVSLGDHPADEFVVGRWYETLEVTLGLESSSSSGQPLEERGRQLARAFASRSDLPLERVKLASAKLSGSVADTAQESPQANRSTSKGVSLQGDTWIANALMAALGSMVGRRLHQYTPQSSLPGTQQGSLQQQRRPERRGTGLYDLFHMAGREQDLKRRMAAAVEGKAAAEGNKAVFHIHPANKELTDLSARLVSDDHLQLLSQALEQEGFQLIEGSVSQRFALLREKAVELEGVVDVGQTTESTDGLDQTEVVIIGCVVGVGGAVLLALLVLASTWWSKSTHKQKVVDHAGHDHASASDAVHKPKEGLEAEEQLAERLQSSGKLLAALPALRLPRAKSSGRIRPVRESNISAADEGSTSRGASSPQAWLPYPPPVFSATPAEQPCSNAADQPEASSEHKVRPIHRPRAPFFNAMPAEQPCSSAAFQPMASSEHEVHPIHRTRPTSRLKSNELPQDDFISPVKSPHYSDSHGLEGTPLRKVTRHAATSNEIHLGSPPHPGIETSSHSGTCSSTGLDLQQQQQQSQKGRTSFESRLRNTLTQGSITESCPNLSPSARSISRLPHVPDGPPSPQLQQMLQQSRRANRASEPQATGQLPQEITSSYATPTKRWEAIRARPPSPAPPHPPKQAGLLPRALQSISPISPTTINTGQQQQQQQQQWQQEPPRPPRPPPRPSSPQTTNEAGTERVFYFSSRTPPKDGSLAAGTSPLSHTTYSPAAEPPPNRPSLLGRVLLRTFSPGKVQPDQQPYPQQQHHHHHHHQEQHQQQQTSRCPPHRASEPEVQGCSVEKSHLSYTSPAKNPVWKEAREAAFLEGSRGGCQN